MDATVTDFYCAMLPSREECYEAVRDLINYTVYRFWRRHGGHLPDLRADADTAWLKGDTACREGRNNAKKYRAEIRNWVWFELFDEYRTKTQHRRQEKTVIENDEYIEQKQETTYNFNMVDYLDELHPDARIVVQLIFGVDQHGRDIAAVAAAKGDSPRNYRSTLRAHLAGQGWDSARINGAFDAVVAGLGA